MSIIFVHFRIMSTLFYSHYYLNSSSPCSLTYRYFYRYIYDYLRYDLLHSKSFSFYAIFKKLVIEVNKVKMEVRQGYFYLKHFQFKVSREVRSGKFEKKIRYIVLHINENDSKAFQQKLSYSEGGRAWGRPSLIFMFREFHLCENDTNIINVPTKPKRKWGVVVWSSGGPLMEFCFLAMILYFINLQISYTWKSFRYFQFILIQCHTRTYILNVNPALSSVKNKRCL